MRYRRIACVLLSLLMVISFTPIYSAADEMENTDEQLKGDTVQIETQTEPETNVTDSESDSSDVTDENDNKESDSSEDNPSEDNPSEDEPIENEPIAVGSCGDNAAWSIIHDASIDAIVLKITGTGKMYDYTESPVPWEEYKQDIHNVIIDSGITYIGMSAFASMENITNVEIPDSVSEIGNNAFEGCKSIKTITIPENVQTVGSGAFKNCSGLESAELNQSFISDECFAGCTYLTNVTFSDSIKEIGDESFSGCSSLKSITIPQSVTAIGNGAFSDCTSIETTVIPDSVTILGVGVFKNCTGLESAELNQSFISDECFAGCTYLTNVTLSDSIKEIGDESFSGCSSLKGITIPQSVTAIGNGAFSDCTSLETVVIPDSVTILGAGVFKNCTGLISAEIPQTYTSIPESCFEGCSKLSGIVFPEPLKTIEKRAFYGCLGIESLSVPAGVNVIGESAYQACSNLKTVNLPGTIISIGKKAFWEIGSGSRIYPETWELYYKLDNHSSLINQSLTLVVEPEGEPPEGGDFDFELDEDGNAIITGYSGYLSSNIIIPSAIDGKHVVALGYGVFKENSRLVSVSLPDSIKSIGGSAFCRCTNLEEINMPSSLEELGSQVFEETAIRSIEIPDAVSSISGNTFRECSKLESVKLPESLTIIGINAFSNCTSLKSIEIPEGTETIYHSAFQGCSALKELVLPEGIVSVGDGAFAGCSLQSITLPATLRTKDISNTAFSGVVEGCVFHTSTWEQYDYLIGNYPEPTYTVEEPKIPRPEERFETKEVEDGIEITGYTGQSETLVVPERIEDKLVVSIGYSAFRENRYVKSVVLPDSIRKIDSSAFYRCTNLEEINMPSSLEELGAAVFEGSGIRSIEIPDGESDISGGAFRNCSKLEYVKLPGSIKIIGLEAFLNCTSLKSIEIPEGTETIYYRAFEGCSSLKELVLPEGIVSVGDSAFARCGLESVKLPATLTSIGDGAFANLPEGSVIYPATWKQFWRILGNSHVYTLDNTTVQRAKGIPIVETTLSGDDISVEGEDLLSAEQRHNDYDPVELQANEISQNQDSYRTIESQFMNDGAEYVSMKGVDVTLEATDIDSSTTYELTEMPDGMNLSLEASGYVEGQNVRIVSIHEGEVIDYGNSVVENGTVSVDNIDKFSEFFILAEPAESIENADIQLADHYVLTDNSVVPVPKVLINGMTLEEGRDYSIECSDNDHAGTAKMTVRGCGNYNGSKTVEFIVCKEGPQTKENNISSTCTRTGSYDLVTYCDECGRVLSTETIQTPISAHQYSAWKTTKAATEIAAGQKTRTCANCGHVEKATIAMLKPTLPAVTIKGPKAAKKAATVKWTKFSKAKQKKIGYFQIQYSTDKSFKKGVKTVTAKKTAASKKITKLTSKKVYYFRIRSYLKSGSKVHVSKWSKVKSVKAK